MEPFGCGVVGGAGCMLTFTSRIGFPSWESVVLRRGALLHPLKNNSFIEAGEMAQRLSVSVLAGDLGSAPSIHVPVNSSSKGFNDLF